jgi:hypothetical protein
MWRIEQRKSTAVARKPVNGPCNIRDLYAGRNIRCTVLDDDSSRTCIGEASEARRILTDVEMFHVSFVYCIMQHPTPLND